MLLETAINLASEALIESAASGKGGVTDGQRHQRRGGRAGPGRRACGGGLQGLCRDAGRRPMRSALHMFTELRGREAAVGSTNRVRNRQALEACNMVYGFGTSLRHANVFGHRMQSVTDCLGGGTLSYQDVLMNPLRQQLALRR